MEKSVRVNGPDAQLCNLLLRGESANPLIKVMGRSVGSMLVQADVATKSTQTPINRFRHAVLSFNVGDHKPSWIGF